MNQRTLFKCFRGTVNRLHAAFQSQFPVQGYPACKCNSYTVGHIPSATLATSCVRQESYPKEATEADWNYKIEEDDTNTNQVQPKKQDLARRGNTPGELDEKFNTSINRRLMKLSWESNWNSYTHEEEWGKFREGQTASSQYGQVSKYTRNSHRWSNAEYHDYRDSAADTNDEEYSPRKQIGDRHMNQYQKKPHRYFKDDHLHRNVSRNDIEQNKFIDPNMLNKSSLDETPHRSSSFVKTENTKENIKVYSRNYMYPHTAAKLQSAETLSDQGREAHAVITPCVTEEGKENLPNVKPKLISNLSQMRPVRPSKTFNLAGFVNDSDVLSNLVKIGMDLSEVEKDPDIASFLSRINWQNDVVPYLLFLHDLEVPDDKIGEVLTSYPGLFQEDLDDLQVRVNYFKSKHFSNEAIARMMSVAPKIFSRTVEEVDAQLGFLQKKFSLTGDDIRYVIQRYPRLILIKQSSIEGVQFNLAEIFGFSKEHQKKILLTWPKTFNYDINSVTETFEYMHQEMGLTHEVILTWPNVLTSRLKLFKPRHEFLENIGRAQYDPTKENFVSLKGLVTGNDEEFCFNVAKCSLQDYNDFLKIM